MTIAVMLVLVALIGMGLLVWMAKGRSSALDVSNPAQGICAVDIEAFRNLLDPGEAEYLRSRLPAGEFRKIQRERLSAGIAYIRGAAHNAAIVMRVGEAARRSENPQVASEGEKLVQNALRLRLYAIEATARLSAAMVFPGLAGASGSLAESYEQMTQQVARLNVLRFPVRGVSAAL
jgi:hypothetical protein